MSAPVFDAALRGAPASLVDSESRVAGLAAQRWQRPADVDDAWLLGRAPVLRRVWWPDCAAHAQTH